MATSGGPTGVVARGSTSGPKPTRTKPVSGAQVRAYAGKADEYAAAAANEVAAGRYIAATSLAIHAAINAADAVCGARLGQRGAGDDHDQVLTLLGQAGPDGGAVGKELRGLLPLKTRAEYDPEDVAPATATKAVKRAERCVKIAGAIAAAVR